MYVEHTRKASDYERIASFETLSTHLSQLVKLEADKRADCGEIKRRAPWAEHTVEQNDRARAVRSAIDYTERRFKEAIIKMDKSEL